MLVINHRIFVKYIYSMKGIILLFFLTSWSVVSASTYYVATTGNNSASGDISHPWATWQKGFESAEPGDTVYFRGGVWYPAIVHSSQAVVVLAAPYATPHVGHDGTTENPICMFAYPGETPVLDCRNVKVPNLYLTGIGLSRCNFWTLKGLTIRNVLQSKVSTINGISDYGGSNNTYENITVHNVGGKGFLYTSSFQAAEFPEQATIIGDTLRYINCDAYNCADSIARDNSGRTDFGNYADGFWGSIANPVTYMIYSGCRAWNISDDGWDSPSNGKQEYLNCWAFNVGWGVGNGIGFRLEWYWEEPAPGLWINRIVTNCIAVFNTYAGFVEGVTGGYNQGLHFYNNISYHNQYGIMMKGNRIGDEQENIYHNNIFYDNSTFDLLRGSVPMNHASNNFWGTKIELLNQNDFIIPDHNPAVIVTDNDFVSLNPAGLTGPRQADGSLPYINFLKLNDKSDLKGAGTYAGMSKSPDIGIDWDFLRSRK